jgi:hypothetical protein
MAESPARASCSSCSETRLPIPGARNGALTWRNASRALPAGGTCLRRPFRLHRSGPRRGNSIQERLCATWRLWCCSARSAHLSAVQHAPHRVYRLYFSSRTSDEQWPCCLQLTRFRPPMWLRWQALSPAVTARSRESHAEQCGVIAHRCKVIHSRNHCSAPHSATDGITRRIPSRA